MNKQECSQHYSGIGGQAVLEGVMMKNGERYAVAVRKEDGSIVLKEDTFRGVLAGTPVRKIPVVRGFFALIDSLSLGLKVTDDSANMYDPEEETESGSAGEKLITGLILILSVVIAVSGPLSMVFNLSDQGRIYTHYVLIVFGATMAVDLLNGVLIAGELRAGGDTRFTMLVECGSIWLVAVPLAFISALVWHLPIHLALLMTRTESLIKVVILSARYKSKKWMNTVIEDL